MFTQALSVYLLLCSLTSICFNLIYAFVAEIFIFLGIYVFYLETKAYGINIYRTGLNGYSPF